MRIQSSYSKLLYPGMNITIPLRCGCPATTQSSHGVKYLLTYLMALGDSVPSVSQRFGVGLESTLKANELYANNSIYLSLTLLIPLQNQPSSSQTIILQHPPPLPTDKSSKKAWIKIVTGVAAGGSVLIVFIGSFCLFSRKKKKRQSNTHEGKVC